MFMRMIYDERLAQAAYLIGCQRTGEGIVIDPERDVDRYIDLANEHGLRIVAVAETHIHADFLSGARELAAELGVKVYVSGEGGSDWQYGWLDKRSGGGATTTGCCAAGIRSRSGTSASTWCTRPATRPSTWRFW
jgi:hydroxyacylglutathione hydrolase